MQITTRSMPSIWALIIQYVQFGVVGLTAAATHVGVFAALIEAFDVEPLFANLVAFSVAVLVSYFGHFRWTFRSQNEGAAGKERRAALVRFIVVALIGLGLNSMAVYVVVHVMHWPYYISILLMLTAVPMVVFVLSKFWAFAKP